MDLTVGQEECDERRRVWGESGTVGIDVGWKDGVRRAHEDEREKGMGAHLLIQVSLALE